MMFFNAWTGVGALVLFGTARGFPLHARETEPCRQVRDAVEKWQKDNHIVPKNLTSSVEQAFIPAVPATPIKPSLAFACLKSVPLDRDAALKQLDYLRPFFEWHSTVDLLKSTPHTYLSEQVDLLGGLDDIAQKLKLGLYANEFEFLGDLYTLSSIRPRDGHLGYTTVLLDLFTFQSGVKFASVSKDGAAVPEVFLYDDLKHLEHKYTPSPVSTIDGVTAAEYLQQLSVKIYGGHDPDARFNGLFPSPARQHSRAGDTFILDLKDTTTVQLHNGTVLDFQNKALVRANFTNITSGADLYKYYGRPDGQGPTPVPWLMYQQEEQNYTVPLTTYPPPFDAVPGNIMVSFLPNDTLSDTAVLVLNSFTPTINLRDLILPWEMTSRVHNMTTNFFRAAKAANRTKLVIDVQGNGGGYVNSLVTVYFNLFPGTSLPLLWQLRAHPQLRWLGDTLDAARNKSQPYSLPWVLSTYIQPNGSAWPSFSDFFGPEMIRGARYTRPSLYNVTGLIHNRQYNYSLPWTTPPFDPENIVLLSSGECASACAVLTDLLTHHGVRTVAAGGRPLEAPMQPVGQVNGGPTATPSGFGEYLAEGLNQTALPPGIKFFNETAVAIRLSKTIEDGDGMSFNLANLKMVGDEDDTPFQFRYRAANCKLFFTWESLRDVSVLWESVRGVIWGDGKCVRGSTTKEDGTVGGVPEYQREVVRDRYSLGAGPGASVRVG